MLTQAENITQLLQDSRRGDDASADLLMGAVYADLRKVARRYMASERSDHTLQPTAIVHEVFLRMFKPSAQDSPQAQSSSQENASPQREGAWKSVPIDWQSRAHFLGVAAKQMRQVLIDHGRSKQAVKRASIRVSLDDASPGAAGLAVVEPEYEFEKLDQLLTLLAAKDPAASKVVELKFFGGLTDKETAEVMETNVAKVRREWEFARGWLRHRMDERKKV